MDDGGFIPEGGGRAALLLEDYGAPPQRMAELAGTLKQRGFSAVIAPAPFGAGEDWTAWLRAAREALMELRGAGGEAAVCGVGAGADLALLLAGCCPVERLALAPSPARKIATAPERFALRALERRALRGLRCVAAPSVILLDGGAGAADTRRARRLARLLGRCEIVPFRDGLAPALLRALGAEEGSAFI